MIEAKIAQTLTQQTIDKRYDNESKRVDDAIRSACQKGESQTTVLIKNSVADDIINELVDVGYEVNRLFLNNIVISWRE